MEDMMYKAKSLKTNVLIIAVLIVCNVNAQQDNKLHLTTGFGVNKVIGKLKNTFRSTIAFNSGFERSFNHEWYAQAELSFNSLRYDQHEKDESSPYLFQNTSSSLFMIGLNLGRNFSIINSPWFTSAYAGTGFINIGKPRVNLDETTNIITQSVVRKSGIIGRAGGRLGIKTKSLFFQTLYLDGSYLLSSVKAEGGSFRSISVFIGMRMEMTNNNKLVKKNAKALMKLR